MAKLEKLRISGFRSFSPDYPQTITFDTPLTIILGQNGCGKTTIIECLKYMCTGQTPPGCGTGASFIHDPKLCMQTMVKAQLKMKVSKLAGGKYDITKNVEVVQQGTKLSFKTLESHITKIDANGLITTMSSKCADFNSEIPWILGVSKPILENVIFCHQEDSNWPLDEGMKVKQKFDAIFSATKYIQCLETMRKLVVEKKQLERSMVDKLGYLKDLKEDADKKVKELNKHQNDLKEFETQQQERNTKKAGFVKRLNELAKMEKNISQETQKLGSYQQKVKSLQESIEEESTRMTHKFDCDDSELTQLISDVERKVRMNDVKMQRASSDIKTAEKNLENTRGRLRAEEARKAKLDNELETHQFNIENRNDCLKRMVEKGEIEDLKGYSVGSSLDEKEAEAMISVIETHLCDRQTDFEQKISQMNQEEKRMQTLIDNLRSKEASLAQEVRSYDEKIGRTNRQMRENAALLSKLQSEIKAVNVMEIKRNLEKVTKQIEEKEQSFDKEEVETQISTLKTKKNTYEAEVSAMKRKLDEMNKQANVRKELEIKRHNIDETNKSITQVYQDEFDELLPGKPTASNILKVFNEKLKTVQNEISKLRVELQKLHRSKSENETTLRHLRREEEEKDRECRELQDKISGQCSGASFEDALSKKEKLFKESQLETGELESTAAVMNRYIQKLSQEDCCPLCHRDFHTKEDSLCLRDELSEKITQLPERVRSAKKRQQALEQQYTILLQMKPLKDQLTAAQRKLNEIKTELSGPQTELGHVNSNIQLTEVELSAMQSSEQQLKNMQGDVFKVNNLSVTLGKQTAEADRLAKVIGTEGGNETIDEVSAEIREKENKLSEVRRDIEEKQNNLMKQSQELMKLNSRYTELVKREMEVQSKQQHLDKKREEMSRLEEEKKADQTMRQEKNKLLAPARDAVTAEEAKKQLAVTERQQYDKMENASINSVRQEVSQVTSLHSNISSYISSNKKQQREECYQAVARIDSDLTRHNEKKGALEEELKGLQEEKMKHRDYEMSLESEKKIRDKRLEIEEYNGIVNEMKERIRNSNLEEVLKEKSELHRHYQEVESAILRTEGEVKQIESQVSQLTTEINSPRFTKATIEYRKQMIRIQCNKMAYEDLNKYYTALDTAIMMFHAEKMTSINRIIEELWRITYRGNDIDRIKIKTDETGSKGIEKKRTYNYKVVMFKGSMELDMRGRCSAGQKVLASLIIRIALAETFSKNCGILALDEPTTNLDRDNIKSLIEALKQLVHERRDERNFQLVLITHDGEFISGVSANNTLDHYYHVHRAVSVGTRTVSKISKEKVSDLQMD